METHTEEKIHQQLDELLLNLEQLVRASCTNTLASNHKFTLREISFNEEVIITTPRLHTSQFSEIKNALAGQWLDCYDINFTVIRSTTVENHIAVDILKRKTLQELGTPQIATQAPPMLHAKLRLPPFHKANQKFDLNWNHQHINKHFNQLLNKSYVYLISWYRTCLVKFRKTSSNT